MTHSTLSRAQRTARIGGAALLLATVLFSAVFVWLQQHFGYPAVLDQPAAEVLPRLLALGDTGRLVWLVYGLVPLLLLPTALGVRAIAGPAAPLASRVALLAAWLAAATMMAGLLRWPSLHWQLAQQLAQADTAPVAREAAALLFDRANFWLGNVVGEFLGELFLNLFFASAAIALNAAAGADRPGWRWLRRAGLAASLLGFVALWRNTTGLVAPLAELNNLVLPLWMAVLGVALLRAASATAPRQRLPQPCSAA